MAPLSWLEIFGQMFVQFMPVWIALGIIFLLSVLLKRRPSQNVESVRKNDQNAQLKTLRFEKATGVFQNAAF